jgi:hypothetical protein
LKGGGMKLPVFFAIVLFVIAFILLTVFIVRAVKYGFKQALFECVGYLLGVVYFSVFGVVFLLCR